MEQHKTNRLDDLFQQAREQAPQVSFEATKNQFAQVAAGATATAGSGFALLKKGLLLFGAVGVVAVSATLFWPESPQKVAGEVERVVTPAKPPVESQNNQETMPPVEIPDSLELAIIYPSQRALRSDSDSVKTVRKKSKKRKKILDGIFVSEIVRDSNQVATAQETIEPDSAYRFPVLNMEQQEANDKQKAKMVKMLFKMNKSTYAFIPMGTMELEEKKVSVQAFYMQTTEVSVLEYRTFLFDLLKQNRKEEFLLAKPDQNQWTKDGIAFMEPMKEHYFSHPAYDNYPVNNISRAGAELYCKWLTTEVNKLNKSKGKPLVADMRIPTNYEWMYAASGGNPDNVYPWGGPYIRNSKGAYLANHKVRSDSYTDDGGFFTVQCESYFPNAFGLYCMSGNLAEMVYLQGDENRPGTKGGSWSSVSHELQINGPDRFAGQTGPSIDIGFRPVVSYITPTQ